MAVIGPETGSVDVAKRKLKILKITDHIILADGEQAGIIRVAHEGATQVENGKASLDDAIANLEKQAKVAALAENRALHDELDSKP